MAGRRVAWWWRHAVSRLRRRAECGTATAELAVCLPALVAVAATLTWGVAVGAAQVRCIDAARVAARAAARGEPTAVAVDAARRAAPRGADVSVAVVGGVVSVSVRADVPGPRAVRRLTALRLGARAEVVAEPGATTGAAG